MRKPSEKDSSDNWINAVSASKLLDIGNSLYNLMLRLLVQVYSMEHRPQEKRNFLLTSAFNVMGCLSLIGQALPDFEASSKTVGQAGMTFSLNRNFSAYEISSEESLLRERIREIEQRIDDLKSSNIAASVLSDVQKKLQMILSHDGITHTHETHEKSKKSYKPGASGSD